MALALIASSLGCGAPERIVFVVVDTLRADAPGFAGGEAGTPAMDALASRGEVVPNVIASFHNTSMTMGAIFTGRAPSLESGDASRPLAWTPRNWCGVARFATRDQDPRRCLPASLPLLGDAMQERGYETLAAVGNAMLFRPAGFDTGFASWQEVGEGGALRILRLDLEELARRRSGTHVTAAALSAVDARRTDRFFLYAHYMDVHDWNLVPGGSYADGVARADAAVAALLAGLEQRGLLEGASIVFTADHGEALGETHFMPSTPRHMGAPSFESVLRVPLILVDVGFEVGDALLRSEDVFRLLTRIAGDPAPDLHAVLQAGEVLVSERLYQVYRQGRYKSFLRRSDGAFHLVDLEADPGERRDVAPEQPRTAVAHRTRLAELTRVLAAREAERVTLPVQDAHRLQILGYIE